jgi:hypothetical protein
MKNLLSFSSFQGSSLYRDAKNRTNRFIYLKLNYLYMCKIADRFLKFLDVATTTNFIIMLVNFSTENVSVIFVDTFIV